MSGTPANVVSIESLRQRRLEAEKALVDEASLTEPSSGQEPGGDEIHFSDEERAQMIAELKKQIEDLPDVRTDKVIEAKLRISSGFYKGDDISLGILEAMLGSEAPPDGTPNAGRSESEPKGREDAASDEPDENTPDGKESV